MLFSAFEHHPHVIVTRLSPLEMQKSLMVLDEVRFVFGKPAVKSAFPGTQFIGIVGSDTAYSLSPNPEALESFMTGIEIPEKYKEHTLGGLMAAPVDSFILALREGNDISDLKGKIGERPIIATIESSSQKDTSSTKIKKALQSGKSIENTVGPNVAKIIEKNKLYLPSK
ncbi:Nucleotidyl transferase family protein [Candidatus Bealeia paramacronuclearis]|uniref:Nucleotidyl transferase family protein n=2 Tax=Candidatus Bealeia paramacronuclearis TaxID=1921001 RepID=A0ABZ2C363_9PROT